MDEDNGGLLKPLHPTVVFVLNLVSIFSSRGSGGAFRPFGRKVEKSVADPVAASK